MACDLNNIATLLAELEEKKLLQIVKQGMEDNVDPMAILEKCREGISIVGEKFEKGDYFISQLMMSGQIFNEVMEILSPKMPFEERGGQTLGKIVFGTVKGDIHNIGKDIVISLLRADGFEVFDLGVDVSAEVFVSKVKETHAKLVCLSGLITISYDGMQTTVNSLSEAGLREEVKVIIGGSLMNDDTCSYVGADGWGNNAAMALKLAHRFIEEV